MTSILAYQVTPVPTASEFAELIHNPGWHVGGIIIAVIGLIVAVVLLHSARNRKQLSYHVLVQAPLVSLREEQELNGRLTVLWDEQPLSDQDIERVLVRVTNTGADEVYAEDWSGPVTFNFGENSEVLTASAMGSGPGNNEARVGREPTLKNQVVLNPLSLGRGQSVTFKALVSHPAPLEVEGKSEGIKLDAFTERTTPRSRVSKAIALAAFLILANLALLVAVDTLANINGTVATAHSTIISIHNRVKYIDDRLGEAYDSATALTDRLEESYQRSSENYRNGVQPGANNVELSELVESLEFRSSSLNISIDILNASSYFIDVNLALSLLTNSLGGLNASLSGSSDTLVAVNSVVLAVVLVLLLGAIWNLVAKRRAIRTRTG